MMTNHVPTLETCRRLKDSGFPQETRFYWNVFHDNDHLASVAYGKTAEWLFDGLKTTAAPLLTEILEQLPDNTNLNKWPTTKYAINNGYNNKFGDNPTEAAAQLWLELKDGK